MKILRTAGWAPAPTEEVFNAHKGTWLLRYREFRPHKIVGVFGEGDDCAEGMLWLAIDNDGGAVDVVAPLTVVYKFDNGLRLMSDGAVYGHGHPQYKSIDSYIDRLLTVPGHGSRDDLCDVIRYLQGAHSET